MARPHLTAKQKIEAYWPEYKPIDKTIMKPM